MAVCPCSALVDWVNEVVQCSCLCWHPAEVGAFGGNLRKQNRCADFVGILLDLCPAIIRFEEENWAASKHYSCVLQARLQYNIGGLCMLCMDQTVSQKPKCKSGTGISEEVTQASSFPWSAKMLAEIHPKWWRLFWRQISGCGGGLSWPNHCIQLRRWVRRRLRWQLRMRLFIRCFLTAEQPQTGFFETPTLSVSCSHSMLILIWTCAQLSSCYSIKVWLQRHKKIRCISDQKRKVRGRTSYKSVFDGVFDERLTSSRNWQHVKSIATLCQVQTYVGVWAFFDVRRPNISYLSEATETWNLEAARFTLVRFFVLSWKTIVMIQGRRIGRLLQTKRITTSNHIHFKDFSSSWFHWSLS